MTTFWCELAWLGGNQPSEAVEIVVSDGRIDRVTPNVAVCSPGSVMLNGLTVPGFANAHSHAFHRVLRGRSHTGRGSFWTWRDQMYAASRSLDPSTYFALARVVFAEMAMAGISAVGEFHYVHHNQDGTPYDDPNAMGMALIAAAAEAGIRITLLDTCYLHGGLGPQGYMTPDDDQVRFDDGSAERWIERVSDLRPSAHSRIGAAIHSVRAVDSESIESVARFTNAGDRPLHVHLSEQPAENEACHAAFGVTPTRLLADAGAVGPNMTAVHATHLADDDIELLGDAGCNICMCPTTERDLADGIGPSMDLAAAGCSVCLGSDSHAVIDMLEEARALELDERLVDNVRGNHSIASLLEIATVNGHRSIGWSDAGRLASGGRADLVTIGFGSVRMAGADAASALGSAVFAGSTADIRHVVVDGRVIVRDGLHLTTDVPRELDTIIRSFAQN